MAFSTAGTTPRPLLQQLSTEQGLQPGPYRALLTDHQGFLWIGSDHGLARFDGSNVRRMQFPEFADGDIQISSLFEDDQHRLFIAASNMGLYQLHRETGQFELLLDLRQQEQLITPQLYTMAQTDADHLLLGISQAVYQFSLRSHELKQVFQFDPANTVMPRITSLLPAGDRVWIGTSNGLFELELSSGESHFIELGDADPQLRRRLIHSIHREGDTLWVAQDDRLYQLTLGANNQIVRSEPITTRLPIYAMTGANPLYLATMQGLYQQASTSNSVQPLLRFRDATFDIAQDQIVALSRTNDGGLWLASRNDGVYFWHPQQQQFQQIQLPQAASHRHNPIFPGMVTALAVDPEGTLWLAGNDLARMAPPYQHLEAAPLPEELPKGFGRVIARIYPEASRQLWLRNGNSLHLYDPAQGRFFSPPLVEANLQPTLEQSAQGHFRDEQGFFWFYNKQQYFSYNPATGELQTHPALAEAIPPSNAGRFLGIRPGHPDELFISAYDRLWLWNRTSQQIRKVFEATPYQPQLKRAADRMCVADNKQLWFTLPGLGLIALDNQDLHVVQQLQAPGALVTDDVFSCEIGSDGQLWFGSNAGLARLDLNTLNVQFFAKQDGLATLEYSLGASAALPNGYLIYGNDRGATLFDPRLLQQAQRPPQVVITAVDSMQQSYSQGIGDLANQSFTIPFDHSGLRVQFSNLNFRDASRARYQVWLEGHQKLTFPEQASNQVVFPQLPPGRYQLHIRAFIPGTGRESTVQSISLHVLAAPWLSSWAIGSYGLLVLIVVIAWLQNRNMQKRLLAKAHDEIKTSEHRLTQALDVVQSGVWDWYAERDQYFGQRISKMLGYNAALNPLTLQQHLTLIHPDDRDGYQQAWQRLLQSPDGQFDFTYRMQHKDGSWLWFRDIGRVTEFSQQARRVIGTYSNITDARAIKEKARLFGEAFQQTRDWVVLLDAKQRVLAANQSFCDVFGNLDDYLINPQNHDLGISIERRRFYTGLLGSMQPNQHWQGEELVRIPDGSERPTLLNISAAGEEQQVEFFVLVFTDITAQKQAEENLRYLANYDALTGLPNRALLMDRIFHGIEQAKREQRSLALCFIDLDKFKQINDSLGHDVGDLLLKQVAKRLTSTLRLTDTVARLGGDEFVVLLEGYKNDDNISHVARKMLKSIGEPMLLNSHHVSVSPSIGIAVFPDDANDGTELMKHADVAMYHAKDLGRNNFQFFIQEMNDKAQLQLQRETRLRSAWQFDEFINFYQPIYDSQQCRVVGAEVLMRWQNADQLVPPTDFIPLAEDLRLIVPMTQALLAKALADLKKWRAKGHDIFISVNLSPRHLEQISLAMDTAALLEQNQLPASCLRFEVTESALMQDHEKAISTMLALSDLGVQLALDDFGTGYSSLKYLKELPIDGIKIDRSFVKDIGIDRNDETIIDAMLSMANSLGMYCVAEGVETTTQLEFFHQRGCFLIQGYLFGKPMPAVEFDQALRTTPRQGSATNI